MDDKLDTWLKKRFYRFDCPSADELGDFYLEILPEPAKKIIRQHLESCLLCREELRVLENFDKPDNKTTAGTESSLLPIRELFKKMSERIKPVIYGLQIPQTELRGINRGLPFQCALEAGDEKETLELYLGIEEAETGYLVQAQCLPAEPQTRFLADALVEIWQEGKLITTTNIDTFYTFHFRLEQLLLIVIRITDKNRMVFRTRILFEGKKC